MAVSSPKRANIDDVVKKIVNGALALHEVEELLDPYDAVDARRAAVEQITKARLSAIGAANLDYEQIKGKNAENVIGGVGIPVGVAGPLKVHGAYAKGDFYVPLGTTEGALIASVNRGAKALTMSGGVTARVLGDRMARAPVFRVGGVVEAEEFMGWISANIGEIRKAAESTTAHGKLKDVVPFVLGNNVWLRFSFDTGDAMGMNMVTIAVEKAVEFIERGFPKARCVAVSGNMDSDKKQSYTNNLLGRGKTVVAEAVLSEAVLSNVLHTTADRINDVNIRKNWLGSARAGSMQFNAHFANIVAAAFIAMGQDLAQVVESSSGYTATEPRGGDLYFSVTLPSIEVGTVGGGTALPAQRAALGILGIGGGDTKPGDSSRKLAEVISSAVLAGELNLLAALSARELGSAHRSLGRRSR